MWLVLVESSAQTVTTNHSFYLTVKGRGDIKDRIQFSRESATHTSLVVVGG